jgi:prepilin signal peptidase PulO-like enzyme (type II secretory pathway)
MLSDITFTVEQKVLLPSSRFVPHISKSSLPLWVQVLVEVSNTKGKMRHCTATISKIDSMVMVTYVYAYTYAYVYVYACTYEHAFLMAMMVVIVRQGPIMFHSLFNGHLLNPA